MTGKPSSKPRNLKWRYFLLALMLGSCGTPIYESYDHDEDVWWIRGTSPGGMYGGFLGTTPSPDAVRTEAARVCPAGYDTISEKAGSFFEGKYFQLRVRCHQPPNSN
jgi:hypothetical protein